MPWIIRIKRIKIPEIRRPAEIAISKSPPGAALRKFDLTVFSGHRIDDVSIIKTLIKFDGNKAEAGRSLNITREGVRLRAKAIRNLPDNLLAQYAEELGVTVNKIKLCTEPNFARRCKVIKALLKNGGNRTKSAEIFKTTIFDVSAYAKRIRKFPDGILELYAKELGVSVEQIKKVCADLTPQKGIKRVDVIRALIATGGNRTKAGEILGICADGVSRYAKITRKFSEESLNKYAEELNVSVEQIKKVCTDLTSKKGIKRVDVIKLLITTGGNRSESARVLGVTPIVISKYAKSIRQMPDAQLRKYAGELKTTVGRIKKVCADLTPQKGIKRVDVIKALIATGGNRAQAAKTLNINIECFRKRVQTILNLPEAEIAQYAAELGVTVEQIREVCTPRLERARNEVFNKK